MARTTFALTLDGGGTSFPGDDGFPTSSGSVTNQNINRYANAGLTGTIQYPLSSDGFKVPMVRFYFLDAYGSKISSAPKVQLRLPPSLTVTNASDYSKSDGIFGAGSTKSQEILSNIMGGAYDNAVAKGVVDYAFTAADGLKYTLDKGLGNLLGFIGSAGLNNLNQYEFMGRQVVNPMSQMLYKGPQYRRYQLPFIMKPKNKDESNAIKKAISTFRLASSASLPESTNENVVQFYEGSGFTFGYPHLTQFDVIFFDSEGNPNNIFRSKPSVIEALNVDYGGQKMTFFEDGNPTDISMTIQLTEITPRLLGDAQYDATQANITLK